MERSFSTGIDLFCYSIECHLFCLHGSLNQERRIMCQVWLLGSSGYPSSIKVKSIKYKCTNVRTCPFSRAVIIAKNSPRFTALELTGYGQLNMPPVHNSLIGYYRVGYISQQTRRIVWSPSYPQYTEKNYCSYGRP